MVLGLALLAGPSLLQLLLVQLLMLLLVHGLLLVAWGVAAGWRAALAPGGHDGEWEDAVLLALRSFLLALVLPLLPCPLLLSPIPLLPGLLLLAGEGMQG